MSFDPDPDPSGQSGAGGTSSVAGKSSGSSGSKNSAGSNATGGSGSEDGGSASGGSRAEAGAAGTESGGTASEGGAAGSSSGGSGGEATAGSSGSAAGGGGSGGSSAEAGNGSGGSSAGSGGTAGSGGSDGGPCTPGTLGAHTYAFCGVVDNAAAAYAKCASLGLGMVTIESKFENDYVQGKQSSTWLGGTDEGMEGEWRWVSTQVLFWKEKPVLGVYNDFIDGQPNNKDNQGNPENCLVLSKSGWNDVGCELGDFKATCESSGGPIGQPQQ